MPLIKSGSREAVGANISEMQKSGHSHEQAVAAALRNARQYGAKFARGGVSPFNARKSPTTQGFLHSPVPGRTDKLPIAVKGGAYVLPADHVAGLGQGNSLAGAETVNKMFKLGPYGTSPSSLKPSKANKWRTAMTGRAEGGEVEDGGTEIVAAGGEIVIPPESIIERFGDLDKGHQALDRWVMQARKKHIKALRGLRPPKKD